MREYEIIRLGHQGDGIADGPIYAPLTLPGETVTGQADGSTLTDVRIAKPSPDRVAPPCRHFKSCGGCRLQHASDGFLAEWKVDVVRNALAAHGLSAPFRAIAVSPPKTRRRATLAARRTKKGAMAGFHMRASDAIVEIPDCQLLHPDLMPALSAAKDLALVGASRKSELDAAATLSSGGLDISVTGGKPLDGPLQIELAQVAQQHALARLTWEGETVVTRQPPEQSFGDIPITPPPGSFLQATAEGEAALQADVAEIVAGADAIIDLFAGCGTFALPLARRHRVHAVEGDKAMLHALDAGWRHADSLKHVTHEARDLFRNPLTPDELGRYEAAVIDPPRAGAEAQIAQLAQTKLPVIAYVSCNPVSFARDARTLIAAGYSLNWLRVVDQFRWSAHVELVASFGFTSG